MNRPPPLPPLSDKERALAGSVTGMLEQKRREFELSAQEVEFRKWCVSEAVKICSAHGGDLGELTRFIYGFCHQPVDKFFGPNSPPSPG